jgi:hypothetical protein
MPFTPAHVAAVLPLVRRTAGRPGWTAALVAGSLAPDLPYYVPVSVSRLAPVDLTREATHSLAALPTTTAVIGLLTALAWDRIAEPVVRDALPRRVAGRLGPQGPRATWRDLPVLYLWTVAGVATHDLWDSFTHSGGPLIPLVAWLRADEAGVPVWSWLQVASSILGLLVTLVWAFLRLRGRPVVQVPRRARWLPWAVGALGLLAALVGIFAAWQHRNAPLVDMLTWFAVTRAGGTVALGVAVVCALWWALVGRRGRPQSP